MLTMIMNTIIKIIIPIDNAAAFRRNLCPSVDSRRFRRRRHARLHERHARRRRCRRLTLSLPRTIPSHTRTHRRRPDR